MSDLLGGEFDGVDGESVAAADEFEFGDAPDGLEVTLGRPQLGTRWTSGDEPPAAVPAVLRPQIAAVDRAMPRDARPRRRDGRRPRPRRSPPR
jgi:hypothetical protein